MQSINMFTPIIIILNLADKVQYIIIAYTFLFTEYVIRSYS